MSFQHSSEAPTAITSGNHNNFIVSYERPMVSTADEFDLKADEMRHAAYLCRQREQAMMAETMANAPNFNEAPPAMATGANFFEGPPAMMTGANFYEGPQNMQYAYTGNTGNTSFGMQGFPGQGYNMPYTSGPAFYPPNAGYPMPY